MIEKIVAKLPRRKKVTKVWKIIDERLASGDAAFCADLGIAIAAAQAADGDLWQYRSAFDGVLRALTMAPGSDNVAQAARLVEATGSSHRLVASMLASCQPIDALTPALAGGGELRACLVHELVLRGVTVAEPLPDDNPLAWLPLTRSELEEHADLPSYSPHGSSYAMPSTPAAVKERATGRRGSSVTETAADTERMAAAVANWAEESNGQIEARTFTLAEPRKPLPDTLLRLGLPCLKKAKPKFWTAVTTPASAWRVLFCAASLGGAYNSGLRGAYGRLAAWQSLGALAGAPEGASVEEVEARAQECAWHWFDTRTAWFENVAWDIGLVSLSPDGRLAVLAATDTD